MAQLRADVGNANGTALTGVTYTITLPAGLTVANIGATPIACGTVSAVAPSTIQYTNGNIAANTPSVNSPCNFSINLTATTLGAFTATSNAITSNEAAPGATASATLTVGVPPTITKSFGAATAAQGDVRSLSFTITNPNGALALSGVAFTDTLPAGVVVAPTPNATSDCGGTFAPVAGAGTAALSNGAIAAGGSCSLSVSVRFVTTGVKNNSVTVTATETGNGNTSNASITITPPPAVPVPALDLRGLLLLGLLLASAAALAARRG